MVFSKILTPNEKELVKLYALVKYGKPVTLDSLPLPPYNYAKQLAAAQKKRAEKYEKNSNSVFESDLGLQFKRETVIFELFH